MVRITKDPEERRNEILEAAERLFATKGYDQTAVSDIVKSIGVAQGTFYYYFKTKEEIFEAVIDKYVIQMMEKLKQVIYNENMTGMEKLKKVLTIETFYDEPDDHLLLDMHSEQHMELHNRLALRMIKDMEPMMIHIVEQGIREGSFNVTYPDVTVRFTLTGFLAVQDAIVLIEKYDQLPKELLALLDIMERLLGIQPGLLVKEFSK